MMKKIYTLLSLLVFSFSAIYAQTGIAIGSNSGAGSYIIGTNAYGPMSSVSTGASWNRHAYIYPASLLASVPNGATIDSLFFSRVTSGAAQGTLSGTVNFKIYLKNTATNSFAAAPSWTTEITGATLVYNANPTAVVGNAPDYIRFDAGSPFVYTGGNLEILVEYSQSAAATGEVGWGYDNSATVPDYANNTVAYISGTSGTPTDNLTTLNLRHPALLLFYTYATAVNPGLNFFTEIPEITCHSTGKTIGMELQNYGTDPIPVGGAAITLDITGANPFNSTQYNTGVIAPGGTETITFPSINLSTPGTNLYTAYVTMAGDPQPSNDSLFGGGITATVISTFPAVETVEDTLPVFSYLTRIAGSRQLWGLNPASPFAYGNADLTDSLYAHGGTDFFLFDSYSGASSDGVQSRLFSNCIRLNYSDDESSNYLTFFMSHDTSWSDSPDSLYISVSTDKGVTWNRIAGFARLDPNFVFPDWRMETVDLSAFGCQTIQIGLEGVSHYGNVIGVDDISIVSTGVTSCTTPLTLVNFTAQKVNKANRLSWTTSQELNTLKFVIEQSRDGRNFTRLGEVAAAGNSSTERTYTYTHDQPLKGYNYYRVKMVDMDNKFSYTPVRSLQNLGINEISSYPNPVKGMMQVAIAVEKNDIATVQITDMSGKTVYSKQHTVTEGENNFTVDASGFNAGNYILKVQLSGEVIVRKFSKL